MQPNPKRNFINLEPSSPEPEMEVSALFTTFCYYYTPDFAFEGESHKAWELVYVIVGEVVLETDEQIIILKPGEAFLHKPEEFHQHRANNVVCNACFISFDASNPRLYEIAGIPLRITQSMQHLIQRITDEGAMYLAGKNEIPPRSTNEVYEFACGQALKNSLELLLIDLIRQKDISTTESTTVSRNEKALVQSIKMFLSQHLTQKLSLQDIANGLGYSVSHICYSFKKCMGMSIIQYFIALRINKAKELIAEGKRSLGEISDFLEFDTIQYFSSQFKKFVGVSPSQYATMMKNRRVIEAQSHTIKIL